MEINTINLVGRAGREPDVRYFELYNWLLLKWTKPIILLKKLDSKTKH